MTKEGFSKVEKSSRTPGKAGIVFSSNEMQLSLSEWIFTLVVVILLLCLLPVIWMKLEKFEIGRDHRFPYQLSNDYWLFSRYCKSVCSQKKALVIGDSVIWGQYVTKEQTLSYYLNELAGKNRFANVAVDGMHPLALTGLIEHYGNAISKKNIILHFNPVWMSSKKHDLQTDKEFRFNHPHLVPQFFPDIPCYRASLSKRIGIIIKRSIPFFSWTKHLQSAYLMDKNNVPMDLALWTVAHPYDNPLKAVMPKFIHIADKLHYDTKPWNEKAATRRGFSWVEIETSLQWNSFRRLINILKKRKNKVFVLFGPLNEHMMNKESFATYSKIKKDIELWLRENNIYYYIPSPLPSEFYADASHPLSDGYALLAKQLFSKDIIQTMVKLEK